MAGQLILLALVLALASCGGARADEPAATRPATVTGVAARPIRERVEVTAHVALDPSLTVTRVHVRAWWRAKRSSRFTLATQRTLTANDAKQGADPGTYDPVLKVRDLYGTAGTVALCVDVTSDPAPSAAACPTTRSVRRTTLTTALGKAAGSAMVNVGAPAPSPFDARGMWIHQLGHSSGGHVTRIVRTATSHGVGLLIVKVSTGRTWWPQFSRQLVQQLHDGKLKVCAYQRVLGNRPDLEARLAFRAVARGADCLVIDAEGEYSGKRTAAGRYVKLVRASVGPDFPIGFTSFPYASLHSRVPYTIFLGPGAAQFNLPQIYWHTIGDSPQHAVRRTWKENRRFGRPIYPIGQTYARPPVAQVLRFRREVAARGVGGESWWVWQLTDSKRWRAISRKLRQG
jgi:hypothetical protein